MKLYSGFALAAAVTVIAGTGMAAETSKFVQTGEAAKRLLETNTINITTAEAIGKACVDEATREGVKISIVMVRIVPTRPGTILSWVSAAGL